MTWGCGGQVVPVHHALLAPALHGVVVRGHAEVRPVRGRVEVLRDAVRAVSGRVLYKSENRNYMKLVYNISNCSNIVTLLSETMT